MSKRKHDIAICRVEEIQMFIHMFSKHFRTFVSHTPSLWIFGPVHSPTADKQMEWMSEKAQAFLLTNPIRSGEKFEPRVSPFTHPPHLL